MQKIDTNNGSAAFVDFHFPWNILGTIGERVHFLCVEYIVMQIYNFVHTICTYDICIHYLGCHSRNLECMFNNRTHLNMKANTLEGKVKFFIIDC